MAKGRAHRGRGGRHHHHHRGTDQLDVEGEAGDGSGVNVEEMAETVRHRRNHMRFFLGPWASTATNGEERRRDGLRMELGGVTQRQVIVRMNFRSHGKKKGSAE